MKKTIVLLASLAALSAHATNTTPPPTQQGATANAGALALAGARSSSRSSVRNTSTTTSAGGAGGAGGAATITGIMGVSGGTFGGNGGNVGAGAGSLSLGAGASIGSPTISTPRQAPSIAMTAPTQPPTSCRGGVSVGGSFDKGSGILGFPIGNDQVCLTLVAEHLMKDDPAFTADDRLRNKCKVEGMADTSACKALAKRDAEASRVTAVLEGRPPVQVTAAAGPALLP